MYREFIIPKGGSPLRKNNSSELSINFERYLFDKIFLINQESFITKNITKENLTIKPYHYYMIINNSKSRIEVTYDQNIFNHMVIYNPYLYKKPLRKINPNEFIENHKVSNGYIDILAKWYSIKFSYPEHNMIFIAPGMGISIQTHKKRSEIWEVISGNPIIINGGKVYYYVNVGARFINPKLTYHSIINPSFNGDDFITIKETWEGEFNEDDIERVFNPNNYH